LQISNRDGDKEGKLRTAALNKSGIKEKCKQTNK